MAHNKCLTFTFLEDIDSITAKSALQILSLNLAYAFLLLNFIVTGLCNSSASYSFTFFPILFSYQETYGPYLLMLFDIHHNYDF